MRILYVTNFYPQHDLGGMEQLCQEAAEALKQRGHGMAVLTSHYGVRNTSATEPEVERSLYLEADLHHYRPLDFFLLRPWRERHNRRALRHAIDALQPDLVFVWGLWNLSQQLACWAERWMGPGRVAYAVAGYWFIEPNAHEAYWSRPANHLLPRLALAPARALALRMLARERQQHPLALRHVSTVSAHVRDRMAQAGRLPHGARVIYIGIDPAPFVEAAAARQPSDTLRLVYFGGLAEHKGVHTAIEALGLLRQQGRLAGMTLTIVGAGHPDYEARLRHLVEQQGLSAVVSFHGRVPRSEVPALLAGFDVFLFTSIWEEPIARTVMEAMASGLGVIASPVGGQREMLEDGVNCLTYAPGDAVELAERIAAVAGSRSLVARLAQAGRETVLQRFALRRMVDEYEAWLQEVSG
ncbi:MAG: glycosyltransferase family 4 protein [Anaerolineae bacterium]